MACIAACHRLCFQDSPSTKIGFAYCCKTMEWFLAGSNRFLFHVVDEQNKVIGYCGGFCPEYTGDGSASGIMQYAMSEAVKGVIKNPWLIFNKEVMAMYPLIFKNIYSKILSRKKKYPAAENKTVSDTRVGLVVIGVHPAFRGEGVFEMLMGQFEKEAVQRRISKMILSVKKENTRAVNAYKKLRWQVVKEHESSFEMIKYITLHD